MQASVHEAKTNLARLLVAVERGERVVITRHGIPAAELIPARLRGAAGKPARPGRPPPEDFLVSLGEDELAAWEGE